MSNLELPHVISLGAGVQSSTMAMMATKGMITPMPIAAIFADTQGEPESVYKYLDWLSPQLSFPVYRVTAGNLGERELHIHKSKKSGNHYRKSGVPFFTLDAKNKVGMLPRKCTTDFKIMPILRKLKELAGVPRGCKTLKVIQWIGISSDEAQRMKPAKFPWVENRWPLIEQGMSRENCLSLWKLWGMPQPPRSACVFCPYHHDKEWLRLKTQEPKEFAKAIALEQRVQEANTQNEVSHGIPFLHRSCKPLDQIEFNKESQQPDQFGNECEGMCGV